jgi:hypothetical protein
MVSVCFFRQAIGVSEQLLIISKIYRPIEVGYKATTSKIRYYYPLTILPKPRQQFLYFAITAISKTGKR